MLISALTRLYLVGALFLCTNLVASICFGMKRSHIYTLAVLLASALPTLGQATPAGVHPAAASSDAWMAAVSRLPWKQRLAAVRARVLCDTLVQPYQPGLCYMGVPAHAAAASVATSPAPAKLPRAKGVTLLYVVNGVPFYDNSAAEAAKMQWLLTPKSKLPKKLEFWPSTDPRLALYGARAAGGAVLLTMRMDQKPK